MEHRYSLIYILPICVVYILVISFTTESEKQISKFFQKKFSKNFSKSKSCPILQGQKHQFNQILLFSLPGSGNTWTRFLIEQATGYATGSVYFDPELAENFIGEGMDVTENSTIVIKSHYAKFFRKPEEHMGDILARDTENYKLSGCVFIFRDIFDAILSEFSRVVNHKMVKMHGQNADFDIDEHTQKINFKELYQNNETIHINAAGEPIGFNTFWHKRFRLLVKEFADMYKKVHKFCKDPENVFILRYEELKNSDSNNSKNENLHESLKNLVIFLNKINEGNENYRQIRYRENCINQNSHGYYHRNSNKSEDQSGEDIDSEKSTKINPRQYLDNYDKYLATRSLKFVDKLLIQNFGQKQGLPEKYFLEDFTDADMDRIEHSVELREKISHISFR